MFGAIATHSLILGWCCHSIGLMEADKQKPAEKKPAAAAAEEKAAEKKAAAAVV